MLILRDLLIGRQYFDELLASPEGIATNVLSDRLKRLQEHGFVEVTVDEHNRRRKRYALTPLGRSFMPVLEALARWGLEHIEGTRPLPEVRAALARNVRSRRSR